MQPRKSGVGVLLLVGMLSCAALAQERKLTGKPWLDMDRGPFFSASIESSLPQRQMTPKGILIHVDPRSSACILFDEDLIRYSAAWTGTLDFHNVVFDGSHQTWPKVVGEEVFGTQMAPGWAKDGSFTDPRPRFHSTDYKPEPPHWQNRAYGPLPHDWAQYKGLYRNGERVILSYTIGGAEVLDSPGFESGLFTRTLQIAPSPRELVLEVLDSAEPASITPDNIVVVGNAAPAPPQPRAAAPLPTDGLVATWMPKGKGADFLCSNEKYAARMQGNPPPQGDPAALELANGAHALVPNVDGIDLSHDFSVIARVKTRQGGTIFSKTSAGKWVPGGKTFFIEDGILALDIGWVGQIRSSRTLNDGQWHSVAVTYHKADGKVQLYIDGEPDGSGSLKSIADPANCSLRLGLTSADFPRGDGNQLVGSLGEVALYNRPLGAKEVAAIAPPHPKATRPVGVAAITPGPAPRWELTPDGGVRLHIPASAAPTRLKLLIGRLPAGGPAAFASLAKSSAAPIELSPLTHGGPARWNQTVVTQGKLGPDDRAYTIDTITLPDKNPWHALMRIGGFDFFKDGKRAALGTWDGDIWIVDGIDGDLAQLTWHRFATGLFQPLGLKIVPDETGQELIYVCCRDQIVRLRDLNGDGEADFYECFNNDQQVTEHFHEFATGLETDAQGNFYYAKAARHALDAVVAQHGTILKVSRDGKTTQVVATGFRAPNGIGIGPAGEIVVSDEEGYWMPANKINLVRPGGFYGNMWAYEGRNRKETDGFDPPLCWLAVPMDRSPAEELWVTSDKWGPLAGHMIHTSYGMGKIFLVNYQIVDGIAQGGVTPIPGLEFGTGIMRGRFHPTNGQLYAAGLVGWSSNRRDPGGFHRIRYTGKPVDLPVGLEVHKDGIKITMSRPLDKALAEDPDSYSVRRWNYRWSKNYGSPQYSVENPKKVGQDNVDVSKVRVSADGRELFLEIPDLAPVMQMQINARLKAADGTSFELLVHQTINKVPN